MFYIEKMKARLIFFALAWTVVLPVVQSDCVVPVIEHGELIEKRNEYYWRWDLFQYEEIVSYSTFFEGRRLPDGSSVLLKCFNYYIFETMPTDKTITCSKGQWQPHPACRFDTCSVPVLSHGDIKALLKKSGDFYWNWSKFRYEREDIYMKAPPGTVIHDGAAVTLFCHNQHFFQETSATNKIITCSKGGWHPNPACRLHRCDDEPPSITNGQPGKFTRANGSVVNYECDDGFELEGHSTIHCAFDTWNGNPPVCKSQSCDDEPPSIINGQRGNFTRAKGSVVYYECDDGFELESHSTVHCAFGTWNGNPPVCKPPLSNGSPPPVENASPVIQSREHGHRIWYRCDAGYVKVKAGNITCRYGKWEGSTTVCADCSAVVIFDSSLNVSIEGNLEAKKGQDIKLMCVAVGSKLYPHWSIPSENGSILKRKRHKRKLYGDVLYISHLKIENVDMEHEGPYGCAVANNTMNIVNLVVNDISGAQSLQQMQNPV